MLKLSKSDNLKTGFACLEGGKSAVIDWLTEEQDGRGERPSPDQSWVALSGPVSKIFHLWLYLI